MSLNLYNPIAILKDLCELASKGNELLKKHFPSPIQKELLQAAARSGEFQIIQVNELLYPIIRVGGIDMGNENDPASLAAYWDSLKLLCANGYIEHAGGALFRLTADGFDKARKLT